MPTPSEDLLAASQLVQSWNNALPDAPGDHPMRFVQLNLGTRIAGLLSQHAATALRVERGPDNDTLPPQTLEALETARRLLDPTDETGRFLTHPEDPRA